MSLKIEFIVFYLNTEFLRKPDYAYLHNIHVYYRFSNK